MLDELKIFNALNLLYKGSYAKLKAAREKFGNWQEAWEAESQTTIDAEKEWQRLEKAGIKLVIRGRQDYPRLLNEMPSPPLGIYYLGDIAYQEPGIAIVGTRAATPAGKKLAQSFAKTLSQNKITVISGLALGIDEFAHKGALEGGTKTIAVLGTPLDHIYPKQNESLAMEILKNNGAIISEFPLGQEYFPTNFLIRNRIISALSSGCLIIESPEKSGAMATAKFAVEQNREIFVVPGDISAKNYKGSNSLIKSGANLVTSPEDILSALGIEPKPAAELFNSADLDTADQKLFDILKNQNEKLTVEQLLAKSEIPAEEINKSLAMLTIKGIIKESNGKYYLQ